MQFNLKDGEEYITLQQLLKLCDIIYSGGEAKAFLAENDVYINGQLDKRRGRKLRKHDVVDVAGYRIEIQ